MTVIISAMAFKGGATKTFTITQLAAACARANLLTVVIDADMQGNAGSTMGVDRTDGFSRLVNEGATWKQELLAVPTLFTNMPEHALLVLPSGFQTSNLKKDERTVPGMTEQINLLRGWADVVLIDTAPGYDDIHAGAYAVSDFIILPTLMELDSVESLAQTLEVMEATEDTGGRVPEILGILPNRFTPKYSSNLQMYDMLKVLYRRSFRLFDPILESVAYLDARNRNMSIYAHAEQIDGGGYGHRFDKRAVKRALRNFDDVIGSIVVNLIRDEQGVA